MKRSRLLNRCSVLTVLLGMTVAPRAQQSAEVAGLEQRTDQMLARLSLEQKLDLLTGSKDMYIDVLPLRVSSAHVNAQSLKQTPLVASVEIANTGRIPAAEVIQLYVSNTSCKNGCPARELRGFAKVRLAPGESRRVESCSHTGPSRTSMWPRTTGAWILANTSSMRARRQKTRR